MKRLACLLMAVMLLSALPEIVSAQSNDPFEQQVIQTQPNSKQTKNARRRRTPAKEEKATPAPTPVVTPAPAPQQPEMTISNPCSEWLDFELISIIGSRGAQTVQLTYKVTSHNANARMAMGGNLISYDSEGEEHNRGYASSAFDMVTDVPVKVTMDIPGKINPTKTTVMPVISFNVGNCRIEIRNALIDWK